PDELRISLPVFSDRIAPDESGRAYDVGGLVGRAEKRCGERPKTAEQRGEREHRQPACPGGCSEPIRKRARPRNRSDSPRAWARRALRDGPASTRRERKTLPERHPRQAFTPGRSRAARGRGRNLHRELV